MNADRDTMNAYQTQADAYLRVADKAADDPDLVRFIAALPPGAQVLDLGAGPGRDSIRLRDAGFDVTALEPAAAFADMIEHAGIPVRRESFSDLTDRAAFDGIWASYSLLHAPREDLPGHLTAIHRALRRGGLFTVSVKVGEGAMRDKFGRFYTYYKADELRDAVEAAGFATAHVNEGEIEGLAGDTSPFVVIHAHA